VPRTLITDFGHQGDCSCSNGDESFRAVIPALSLDPQKFVDAKGLILRKNRLNPNFWPESPAFDSVKHPEDMPGRTLKI
jgi:hypothetical protein